MESTGQLNLNDIGDRIRYKRKALKLSQEKLGELINVSANTVSAIENGTQYFGIDKLDLIVKALGMNSEELLYGKCKCDDMGTSVVKIDLLEELQKVASSMSELELKRLIVGLQASMQVSL